MVILDIDDEMKDLAVAHCEERMRYEYNRFGFGDRKRKNMILIGTLGQLIFKKYLDGRHIVYDYQLQAGKYDDFDFEIGGEKYEIKTSGYTADFSKLHLLYSRDQYESGLSKEFKYCVQIFVDGFDLKERMLDIEKSTSATIAGYIEFDNIANYRQNKKFYGDDYSVPLSDLKDIEALL